MTKNAPTDRKEAALWALERAAELCKSGQDAAAVIALAARVRSQGIPSTQGEVEVPESICEAATDDGFAEWPCKKCGATIPDACQELADRMRTPAAPAQSETPCYWCRELVHESALCPRIPEAGQQSGAVPEGMVLVSIDEIDRIARDCEHGSRIWRTCDEICRRYRLASTLQPATTTKEKPMTEDEKIVARHAGHP